MKRRMLMRIVALLVLIGCIGACCGHGDASDQPAKQGDEPAAKAAVVALDIQGAPQIVEPDPYADETKEQRDARMRWWREAKFGMFIHWGVYAVPAGTWNGKQIPGIGEWIMNRGKIPCADYQAFAKQFNPVKYNADEWVRIAKDAGMQYIVITSKHHDGFALFDSKASDWNVVKATPYGKDLLAPLADACRKHGLKLGFYYSQAQDWNNGGSAAGGKWDKAQDRDMDDYIDQVAVPQVREILTRYGEFPAVLWWDTPIDMNRQRAEKLISLLKLKPGIIHNNRLGGGFRGDTETPEQHIPATGFPGRDWETCMTMNGTWGYKSYDDNWKSTETLLRNLIDIASKGGNYLLNVGPTAEGLIPHPSIDRLAEVGRWTKINGDAIYGTTASPFKKLPFNGRCTRKPGKLYLHVFDWPAHGTLLVPMASPITKAYLLTAPANVLPVTSADNGQRVALPTEAPDKVATVIVAEIAGEPEIIVPPVQPVAQAADGTLKLKATEAILHGELRLESKHRNQNIGYWLNAADWVEWPIDIRQPGKFTVTAEIAAEASGTFEIIVGDQKLKAKAPSTGDYGTFQEATLGEIEIPAGKTTLVIRAVKEGWRPFNLTTLSLSLVK
jgi:alpha-L-fucosidase